VWAETPVVRGRDQILSASVNGSGAVCDQKTSKFFVSHVEESMARHVSVRKLREGLENGAQHGGTRWKLETECLSLFQVLLKFMLTYGKG
jgi:hypothetical protein